MSETLSPPGELARYARLLGQHKSCLEALRDFEATLDRTPEPDGAWVRALAAKLPMLAEVLREHFEDEEQGPLFRSLPEEFPQLSGRLARLQREHVQILEQIASLTRATSRLVEAEVYDLRELAAKLQLLAARVRRHEAEEDEALLSAYWDEAGCGD